MIVVPDLAFKFQTPFFDGDEVVRLNQDENEDVNESRVQIYSIKCQKSKKVFTEHEIAAFKLQRRAKTTEV